MNSIPGSRRECPLVTVAITCFNAENTIGAAIASAAAQSWPNLEIVVADDASSDDSREVVRSLAERDPRVRLLCHDRNRGYAGALNSIVEAARGEFVAIFDDDDTSEPSRVAKQCSRLTEYERSTGTHLVFCYTNRTVVVDGGRVQSEPVRAIGRVPLEPSGKAVADFLLWHREDAGRTWGQLGSCTLLARRSTLLEVGALDETFRRGAEWDLAVRLALMGGHFIAVNEPLVAQRKTLTPDKGGDIPLKYTLQLREKYREYLAERRLYSAAVAITRSRFHYARAERVRSYLQLALACLYSPTTVLPNELRKWTRRNVPALGSLARSTTLLFALRATQQVARLAMLYFVVRALDPAQFGRYQFVLTCLALASITALPGLNNALMQSVARGFLGAYRPIVARAFAFAWVGSAVLLGLAAYHHLRRTDELRAGFLLAAALFPFAYGLEQWKSLRSGAEDFAGLFKLEGAVVVVLTGLMIVAVTMRPGDILVPLTVLLGVQSLVNAGSTLRAWKKIPSDAPSEEGVIRHGFRMTFYASLNILANQVDKVLIFAFLSPAALALFVAAERLPELAKNAVQDIAAVLAPRFAKRERYTHALDRVLRRTGMLTGAVIVAFAFALLPWLLVVIFGESYRPAIPYAQALMCSVAIGNTSTLRYRYVASKLDDAGPRTINIVMSSTRIVASLVLVPLWGLPGAVVSAFIYRVAMSVIVHVVIRKSYLTSGADAR